MEILKSIKFVTTVFRLLDEERKRTKKLRKIYQVLLQLLNNKFFIRSDLKKGNVLKRSIKYGLKSSLVYDDRFLDYSSN